MQFRNTRTPAGFEPKACKTQARKTLRTLPLESIKKNNSIAREMPLQLAKPLANAPWRHSSETPERQQDSSPRHAKHKPENSPNVTFRIHKKQQFYSPASKTISNVPWRHRPETLERHQYKMAIQPPRRAPPCTRGRRIYSTNSTEYTGWESQPTSTCNLS